MASLQAWVGGGGRRALQRFSKLARWSSLAAMSTSNLSSWARWSSLPTLNLPCLSNLPKLARLVAVPSLTVSMVLLAGCGQQPTASQSTSLYGTPQLQLIKPTPGTLSASVGSLQVVLPDPDGGPRSTLPACTGMQISPHHLLTAGHCQGYDYIFNKYHIAAQLEPALLKFMVFGKVVRLTYDGALDERSAAAAASAATFKTPLFWSRDLDVAIYELPPGSGDGSILDLRQAAAVSGEARIWGYPNGVPLTIGTCHLVAAGTSPWLVHDCDSLAGSSGALIGDLASGLPVAMHLAGPTTNDGAAYEASGHFESAQDFARRRGCPTTDNAPAPACVRERGFNRAVPLTAVRERLMQEAPQLWAAIVGGLDDLPHAHPDFAASSVGITP